MNLTEHLLLSIGNIYVCFASSKSFPDDMTYHYNGEEMMWEKTIHRFKPTDNIDPTEEISNQLFTTKEVIDDLEEVYNNNSKSFAISLDYNENDEPIFVIGV